MSSTCYKFTVANAHEAASVIRERLGEHARVLSVRTVEPSGLRGLWASPKLEVIASVDLPATPAVAAPVGSSLVVTSDEDASPAAPLNLATAVATTPTVLRAGATSHRTRNSLSHSHLELAPLLRRSGFSEAI